MRWPCTTVRNGVNASVASWPIPITGTSACAIASKVSCMPTGP